MFSTMLLTQCAFAGTITGKVATATTGAVPNATITLTLSQAAILPGSFLAAASPIVCYTDLDGKVIGVQNDSTTSCVLTFNDALIPTATYYQVTVLDRNGSKISGFPQKWFLQGGTVDLSLGTPIFQGTTIYPTAIVAMPAAQHTQSISGPLDLRPFRALVKGVQFGDGTVQDTAAFTVPPLFQTDEVNNQIQSQLDLKSGNNIHLTNIGGRTVIDSIAPPPPAPPSFKTNGILNPDQGGLNIVAGSGVVLSISGNTVTINVLPGGGSSSGGGSSGYIGVFAFDSTGNAGIETFPNEIFEITELPPSDLFPVRCLNLGSVTTKGKREVKNTSFDSGIAVHVYSSATDLNGLPSSCNSFAGIATNGIIIGPGDFAVFVSDPPGVSPPAPLTWKTPGINIQP